MGVILREDHIQRPPDQVQRGVPCARDGGLQAHRRMWDMVD
jgi:hypothetical protein